MVTVWGVGGVLKRGAERTARPHAGKSWCKSLVRQGLIRHRRYAPGCFPLLLQMGSEIATSLIVLNGCQTRWVRAAVVAPRSYTPGFAQIQGHIDNLGRIDIECSALLRSCWSTASSMAVMSLINKELLLR